MTNRVGNSLEYLECKPRPVFDRAAVRVGTSVGDVLRELVDEVSVRAVDLDAVKPGTYSVLCGGLEKLHVLFDL